MGSELNITPKKVVECGLSEDGNATAVGDSEASPESNALADHKNNAALEQEFEKNLKGNPKCSKQKKQRSKGKVPAVKKVKAALAESNSDLVKFSRVKVKTMRFSSTLPIRKQRDLKSQKLIFDAIKEIEKFLKQTINPLPPGTFCKKCGFWTFR